MKHKKKAIIIIISSIFFIAICIFSYYKFIYDSNSLTLTEKKWLTENKKTLITFNVPNDLNVFGSSGVGVFYNFIDDFTRNYDMAVNKNAVLSISDYNGLGFYTSLERNTKDIKVYEDHYVVISKNNVSIHDYNELTGSKIGVLSEGFNLVSTNYKINASYTTYDARNLIIDALNNGTVNYIIVPLNEYMDYVLSNNCSIVFHLSDLLVNYYLDLGDDEVLGSIIKKYYTTWVDNNLEKYFYKNNYSMFVEKLGLTQIETDSLTNKTYAFGFVNSTPYQTLSSSKYGGIIMSYIADFSKFSNVEFTYNRYKEHDSLNKAYKNKKIDLFFNLTGEFSQNYNVLTNIRNKFYITNTLKDNTYFNNVNELKDYEVYVIKDSIIAKYLSDISGVKLKKVKNEKELIKMANKGQFVAIDSYAYNYFVNHNIKNTYISYTGYTNNNSFIYQKNNDAFYKLFSNYINYLDQSTIANDGILSFKSASTNGSLVSAIAKYVLVTISISIILIGIILFTRKHIKLDTKIRKEDKIKFVDLLTSLKNRNYLNEKISVWNQNTIYPQAIIVIDLNRVKYLNDSLGHEEGDRQITSAANILIKTQLDNTEIMRTDGNEFTIYLVGYNEKQILNYMRKLIKEFKILPYEYGAAFGFKMIVDDLLLIDDAITEATIQMRNNKDSFEAAYEKKEI